ncbi:MAG: hypothetical protein COA52_08540 [Hyphomicrobiales bacterium]|nr:MAG: hypothetical protein COA52_08540 [Hyphomicrobiales bacterium]
MMRAHQVTSRAKMFDKHLQNDCCHVFSYWPACSLNKMGKMRATGILRSSKHMPPTSNLHPLQTSAITPFEETVLNLARKDETPIVGYA